jgi:alpha-tubulin suppressor-like RCC1 family protein
MYAFIGTRWTEVVRVFAAKVNTNGTFASLGNMPGKPYGGSSVRVNTPNTRVGHIIADTAGNPIRRSNGTFFTTEDDFFVNGSPINSQRLESSVIQATALQTIAKFQVVKFSQFGKVSLATYQDIQTTVIAMSFEDLGPNSVGDFCVQGVVTNPDWNFIRAGAELWVTGSGLLTEVDPHVLDPIGNPVGKIPVGRVLTQTSIIFDQGMGGRGETGLTGVLATNATYGISKLSVPAENAAEPIVVGDNDPRLIPGTLDGLSDVVVPTPTIGDILEWDGTNWINHPLYLINSLMGVGSNLKGQLGVGTTTPTSIFQQSTTITDWSMIGGDSAILGIRDDGTLWSWGNNFYGTLGDGTTVDKSTPTQVGLLSDWSWVANSDNTAAAIKTDGTLWTWGSNISGQLGDGTIVDKSSPVQVGLLTSWKQAAASSSTTAAIKTDGTLWAWGDNTHGQLGDGTIAAKSSPIQIGSLTNWDRVYCGLFHTAAIKTDGTLWAWGNDSYGQLGDGGATEQSSPIQVGFLADWAQLSVGGAHNIGIKTDGTLWSWGLNIYGQLGDGTTIGQSSPIQVGASSDWKYVQSGFYHSAAIKTDGTLWTWGDNTSGHLGDGTSAPKSSPIQIGTSTFWNRFATAGTGNTFAFQQSRGVVPIVNGGTGKTTAPEAINNLLPDQSGNNNTVLSTDGVSASWKPISINQKLMAWGFNVYGGLGDGTTTSKSSPVSIGSPTNWMQISTSGASHSAAITLDGTLWTWGQNLYGQLGDGTSESKFAPAQVGILTDWKQVSSGNNFDIAIKNDGTLWSWGSNTYGTLGVGASAGKSSPIQVGLLTDWAQVSSGWHTLAIKTDGTLWAWGYNQSGPIGDGTIVHKSSPIQVGLLTDWKQISAGSIHSTAIKTDGTLWAWGSNTYGALGDDTTINKSSPIQLGLLSDWKQVEAGNYHTSAIKTDGTLWTWGKNVSGELGDGTVVSKSSPIQIGALTDWAQVSCYDGVSAAIKTDGTLWAWGWNDSGQLGDGTIIPKSSPIQVGSLTSWTTIVAGPALMGITQQGKPVPIYQGGTGEVTAPAAINALLPSQLGNNTKVLTTDGSNTSWTAPAGGGGATIVDDTTTNAARYLTFTNITSGPATELDVSSSKLTYNPFTGTVSATNFFTTSDENLKLNIQPIVNGLDVINNIDGVGFNWRDTGIHTFGVIAQQVEQFIPDIVNTSVDGQKSVEYNAIIPFLIESVKELSARIELLENK